MPDAPGEQFSAGAIFLDVIPSYRGFQNSNARVAKELGAALEKEIDESAKRGGEKAAAQLDKALKDRKIKVEPEIDSASMESQVAKILKDAKLKIKPEVDTAQMDHAIGSFDRAFRKAMAGASEALGEGFDDQLDKVRGKLTKLRDAKIGVDITADQALRELAKINLELNVIQALSPEITVRADTGAARKELAAFDKLVQRIDHDDIEIKVDVDSRKARRELSLVDRLLHGSRGNAENTANSFRAFNGVLLTAATIGPALVPALAGVAGGLALIAAAGPAAVAGLGATVIGLSGLGDAIGALGDVQKSAATDTRDAARTMTRAAESVTDAQKRLTRAKEDAAEANQDAARRVARAERDATEAQLDAAQRVVDARDNAAEAAEAAARRVEEAQRRAAQAAEQALRRQQDAEKRLADAQRDAKKAVEELREARAEAQKDLDDIADRQKQNAVDERQAVIDLFEATQQETATRQDPGATNLEKEQASINLENAKLRLKEIRDEEKELLEQRSKGVNDTERVKSAEENVRDALERQNEAARAALEAQRDLNEVRIESARDVAEALKDQQRAITDGQRAITDAIKEQAEVARDSAEAIQDAERAQSDAAVNGRESVQDAAVALARAQRDYNDALYDTGVIGSASQQKLAEAMAKLGPAGQAFALFIHGLRDDFFAIRNEIQSGWLPKLQIGIQSLIDTYGPGLLKFSGDLGKTLGELSEFAAETLTNEDWQRFFSVFADLSPKLMEAFGKSLLNWVTAYANIAVIAAPFTERFAAGLQKLSEKSLAWTQSEQGSRVLTKFFEYVERIGPKVLDFVAALALAFFAVAEALAPFGEMILEALTGMLNFIATMDPKVLQAITFAVVGLAVAFQLANGAVFVLGTLAAVLSSPLGLAVAIIAAVALGLIYLYKTSDTARVIIQKAWSIIFGIVKWWWDNVTKPVLDLLAAALQWLWEEVLQPVVAWMIDNIPKAFGAIKVAWETYGKPALSELGGVLSWVWTKIIKPVFDAFKPLVEGVFGAIEWAWENVLYPVWSAVGKIVWELWKYTLEGTFRAIGVGWGLMVGSVKTVWDKILKPVFDAIAFVIGSPKDNTGLVGIFHVAVEGIRTIWDKLGDIAKKPIKFIIDTVINNGLIAGYNQLAKFLKIDTVQPIKLDNFHRGGIKGAFAGIYPGYTPGRDTGAIMVGGGEAIMRPEWTRAVGPDWVHQANKRARMGGVQGVRRFLQGYQTGGIAGLPAFANGGVNGSGGGGWNPWERMSFRGEPMNARTIKMILAAEKLLGRTMAITQGSFQPATSYSGTTHTGGGVFDSVMRPVMESAVRALRAVGFAAWDRTGKGNWAPHIHAVAIGDPTASGSAKNQVQSYLSGGDGLGGTDDGPKVKVDKDWLKGLLGSISLVGDLTGAADWVADAVQNPGAHFRKLIEGPMGKLKGLFGDNAITNLVTGVATRALDALIGKIEGLRDGTGADTDIDTPGGAGLKGLAQSMAAARGWTGAQWNALDWIVNKESSWNPTAQNPSSTAFGLFQFLNGTWKGYGPKTSDPQLQLQYGMQYIADRYGTPARAMAFHKGHNWYNKGGIAPVDVGSDVASAISSTPTGLYDTGGVVPQGLSQVLNMTGANEHAAVFTTDQWERLSDGGPGVDIDVILNGTNMSPYDVADELQFQMRRAGRSGKYGRTP
jgi:hypothetical protein